MMYSAFVKDKETGEKRFIESDYPTRSNFLNDLKANGYTVYRAEPKEVYDYILRNTNGSKTDWEIAKKLYKEGKPLTKEEYEKMKNGDDNDYEIVNDKSLDAIKDNFTPPGAKIGVDNEFVEYSEKPKAITKDHVEKYGEEMLKKLGASDEQIAEAKKEDDPPKVEDVDTSAIDEKDSGKSGEDDLDLYMKDLNDYMSKNPKGRDDIPVTTRR